MSPTLPDKNDDSLINDCRGSTGLCWSLISCIAYHIRTPPPSSPQIQALPLDICHPSLDLHASTTTTEHANNHFNDTMQATGGLYRLGKAMKGAITPAKSTRLKISPISRLPWLWSRLGIVSCHDSFAFDTHTISDVRHW